MHSAGAEAELPACEPCGVCCFAPNPGHLPLSGADHARLTVAEQLERTEFRGNRCYMKVVAGRCINLVETAGRFRCAIYARRPQVCRDYARGGPACAYDRERLLPITLRPGSP